jgi:DNA replication licensing factor MCM7
LIEVSTSSLAPTAKRNRDPMTMIFELIKEISTRGDGTFEREVSMGDIRERVISKGLSESDLERCIKMYSDDDVWMVCGVDNSRLRWIMIEEE